MNTIKTIPTEKQAFKIYIYGGLIAAILSVVSNNLYNFLYSAVTDFGAPKVINIESITIASIIPTIIGTLLYFGLSRFTKKATLIFIIISSIITIVSCFGAFGDELQPGVPMPEGFAGLTVPLHLLTGLIAIVVIPKYVNKKTVK